MSPFSAADYAGAIRKLLPRGRVWPGDPGTNQDKVLASLSSTPARLDAAALGLLSEALPGQAVSCLAEWEETLGLPDPCLGEAPTLAQRQAQVAARFATDVGQSAAFFVAYAAILGFRITIATATAARTGTMRAGQRVASDDWAHVWVVTILSGPSSASPNLFRAGRGRAGDPLGSEAGGQSALECEFNRLKPAHTVLRFAS